MVDRCGVEQGSLVAASSLAEHQRVWDVAEDLGRGIKLHCGDCLHVLKRLPENSIDSCVTDPPYLLTSIVKRFGADNAAPARSNGPTGIYKRISSGYMNLKWDAPTDVNLDPSMPPDLSFHYQWAKAVYRVLKPGAHACVFIIPKHVGVVQMSLIDAGFETRDCIVWAHSQGFPKNWDVSKQLDKMAGAKREVIETIRVPDIRGDAYSVTNPKQGDGGRYKMMEYARTIPATAEAKQWAGWGSALRPAIELILLVRKHVTESSVAANVLKWGTGAVNLGASRIDVDDEESRWPSNFIHDGSEAVVSCFPDDAARCFYQVKPDSPSYQRLFHTTKADADDRLGFNHPTVKPLDLIQYLVRLITPPGGTCLDPFAGTGTTGEAAWREGFKSILIEREKQYQRDIRRRVAIMQQGGYARETAKVRKPKLSAFIAKE